VNKYKLEHEFFRVSIFLKGLYSFFELLAGAILFFVVSKKIFIFIYEIFQSEFLQDVHEFIIRYMPHAVENLPYQLSLFISLYLISHGIVKLGLIIALWKEKRWAYPLAIVVFGGFIVYQIYKYAIQPSLVLLVLTDLDLAVIILTWLEWKNKGKGRV